MVRLVIESPLANCLVVSGYVSKHQGPALTLACCFSRAQEPWWSRGSMGRNLHPSQAASTAWVVPHFSPRSIIAHDAAGISRTSLQTGLVECPVVSTKTRWKFATEPKKKIKKKFFLPGETFWLGQRLKFNSLLHV